MRKIAVFLYYILLLCFSLPSGSILGIPIKLLLIISCFGSYFIWAIKQRKVLLIDDVLAGFIAVFIPISFWCMISVINGYTSSMLSCLKSFISLLSIVIITHLYVKNKLVEINNTYKVLCIAAILCVVFKYLGEILMVFNIVSWDEVRFFYAQILDAQMTTMQMPIGNVVLYRIMVPNDSLPLIILSFYLIFEKKNIFKKLLILLLMGGYTFIIYSRVVIIQYLAIVILYIVWVVIDYVRNTTKNKTLIAFILIIGCATGIMMGISTKPQMIESAIAQVETVINERFIGTSAEASDSVRVKQKEYLWAGIDESPVIGHGLGSYVREYSEGSAIPYSYEAEYISFIYQFGYLGFVFIILAIIVLFYKMCFEEVRDFKLFLVVLLNLGIWTLKPLFNPQFLSSNSGMVIISIYLAKVYYTNLKTLNNVELEEK